jgi:hypothetical protein
MIFWQNSDLYEYFKALVQVLHIMHCKFRSYRSKSSTNSHAQSQCRRSSVISGLLDPDDRRHNAPSNCRLPLTGYAV